MTETAGLGVSSKVMVGWLRWERGWLRLLLEEDRYDLLCFMLREEGTSKCPVDLYWLWFWCRLSLWLLWLWLLLLLREEEEEEWGSWWCIDCCRRDSWLTWWFPEGWWWCLMMTPPLPWLASLMGVKDNSGFESRARDIVLWLGLNADPIATEA
jgi:hypothetical protein